ncbi:MAG TPA: GYF domain-containing protein [Arenimonas sp.]|uniref:GYF domain-containing protein n=1 Tax=Arenimonas sp. TaxID=1872635 RepID=UPI002D805CED|nr:GYF domain-containing protein [Arenimonas sp.]HEU0154112.1 GYF domain-containing protein [Arenimonas sp.]
MSTWFYVDNARNRQGPVEAEAVAAAFAAGQVNDDSLVWREGLAQWAPLRQFRDELGMGPPAMGPAAVAAPSLPGMAPRKSNTGCLVIGLVVGVGGLIMMAILAAIALPAYQDYVVRSKLTMAYSQVRAVMLPVAEYQQTHGRCPTSLEELGVPRPSTASGPLEVELVALDASRCVIEVPLDGLHSHPSLAGRRLYLTLDETGNVTCSTDLDSSRYAPTGCQ